MIVLAGCSKGNDNEENKIVTEPVEEGGYRTVYPFEASDAREVHTVMNLSPYDVMSAGKGLERYAKDYFSTDSYYLQDGKLLTRDRLMTNQSENDTEGLLNRNNKENPYGLNPTSGSTIPVDDQTTITVGSNTVPIVDVIEYDFVKDASSDADIEGIAVSIILNPNIVDEKGNQHTLSEKSLRLVGEEAGRKLVDYLKTLPEVSANTPVMVGLFEINSEDASLGGTYLALGYGSESIDHFESVEEDWVIIPSQAASDIDPQIVSQFNTVKNSLQNVLPNDVGIIGKGFYIDNELDALMLNVETTGKTYSENLSVVQLLVTLMEHFNGDSYQITVKVNANQNTFAMLQRAKGEKDISVIME